MNFKSIFGSKKLRRFELQPTAKILIRQAEEKDIKEIANMLRKGAKEGYFAKVFGTWLYRPVLGAYVKEFVLGQTYFKPKGKNLYLTEQRTLAQLDMLKIDYDTHPCVTEMIEVNSKVVGFHTLLYEPEDSDKKTVDYYYLYIKPEYRKNGLATKLIEHALQIIPKNKSLHVESKTLSAIIYKYLHGKGFNPRPKQVNGRSEIIYQTRQ